MVTRLRRPVAFALALAAATAWADWQSRGIGPKTPNDIDVADAGVAVIAYDLGLVAAYNGPGEPSTILGQSITDAGRMVGGRMGPNGCVFGQSDTNANLLPSTPACGASLNQSPVRGVGFRSTPSGGAFQEYASVTQFGAAWHGDAGYDPSWTPVQALTGAASQTFSLAATTASGRDWGVIATTGPTGSPGVFITTPGLLSRNVSTLGRPTELAAFRHGAAAAVLVGLVDGGLVLHPDLADAGAVFSPVARPPAGELKALAFTEEGGGPLGLGFGLAAGDGGVWGAVPNPAAPAQVWVLRGEISPPNVVRARCLNAYHCVLLSGDPASSQAVSWYFNLAAPALDGGVFTLDAGATQQLRMPIVDSDQDPLWVTWVADAGALSVVPVGGAGAPFNDLADVTAPSNVACGTTAFPFSFFASDGLAAHSLVPLTATVLVNRNAPPATPAFGTPGITVFSGLGAQQASYTVPATGCAATGFAVSAGDGGFTVTEAGGVVTVTPSATFCGPPAVTNVTLTLTNDAGQSSAVLPVTVVPYGAPTVTGFSCGPLLQIDAGSSSTFGLNVSHPCSGAAGFPGFDALISVDGGGPSVTVTRSPDGGITVASSDVCATASLQVFAQGEVRGEDAGRVSTGTAAVTVSVVPNFPLLVADQFDAGPSYDPANSQAVGDLSLTASCAAQRGLDARIAVYGSAGAVISGPQRFGIPGAWALPVPGGCSGGAYSVRAELMNVGGAPTGIEQVFPFVSTPRPAGVGTVTPDRVQIRCGEPVVVTASAQPAAGSCFAQEYVWNQVGGPTLQSPTLVGQNVTLNGAGGFDDFAGAVLELEVSSDAGQGNIGKAVAHSIAFEVAPFVRLTQSIEPLPAREGESFPVRATLENTSDCDVGGLVLREELGRLRYVANSARVAGERISEPAADPLVLALGPVAIAAHGKTEVTWLARAPLSSRPELKATVAMREARVDLPAEVQLPASCSCGSGEGLLGTFGLWLSARLFRKARRRCG